MLRAMIPRTLETILRRHTAAFPAILVTGPRQSGKTTLTRAAFPEFHYISLEDLQNRDEAMSDPRGFLRRLEGEPGVILDEIQRAPDLISYLQGFFDERRSGPFILTGSEQLQMSQHVGQTLAGRVAILELLPFSLAELAQRPALEPEQLPDVDAAPRSSPPASLDEILFTGLFPPIHDRKPDPSSWLDGYIRTYLERDVRSLATVGDLDTFTRFVGLCAGRAGQLLNLSSLGSDAGVAHTTARRWLSILRAGYLVDLIQPHFENFSKRLVKTPKLYFTDTGLLCRLLGIRHAKDLHVHPLRGAIVENLVYSELRKVFLHHGQRAPLYFWRDGHGHEIDFIVDYGMRRLPIEVKAGETLAADAFKGLDFYAGLSKGAGRDVGGMLVWGGSESYTRGRHQVRAWWACS